MDQPPAPPNICWDGSITCNPCPPPPPPPESTPYLFVNVNNKYWIENDIMFTYKAKSYEAVKKLYEKNNDHNDYSGRPTDYYLLRLNPTAGQDGIKLLIKELEPEESHFDQIRLLHIIYPKDSQLVIDNESQTIHSILREKMPDRMLSCIFNNKDECKQKILATDDLYLEGFPKDEMVIRFNVSGLKGAKIYLNLNSWGKETIRVPESPLDANASPESFNLHLIDESTGKNIRFKDVHPLVLESNNTIDLENVFKDMQGDILQIKISWTGHHFIDEAGLIKAGDTDHKTEELPLINAVNSSGEKMITNILKKDFQYAHTVRGDQIELTFQKPSITPKEHEKESYIIVSSGFYHSLRRALYPNVDPSFETFEKELDGYVDELKDLLKDRILRFHVEEGKNP
ncbi:MAG TPA: hypothetical protein VI489_05665 [Candidatus Brocadiaceae bacterium]